MVGIYTKPSRATVRAYADYDGAGQPGWCVHHVCAISKNEAKRKAMSEHARGLCAEPFSG